MATISPERAQLGYALHENEGEAFWLLGPAAAATLPEAATPPRSANCTALSTVMAAGMSRLGLEQLIQDHPRAAAKLLRDAKRMTVTSQAGSNLDIDMTGAPTPSGVRGSIGPGLTEPMLDDYTATTATTTVVV